MKRKWCLTMRKRSFQSLNNDKKSDSPQWMTTYSDMVTLLLAFFILLYSYSVVDVQRFQEVLSSIQVTFLGREGILESSPLPAEDEEETSPSDATVQIN